VTGIALLLFLLPANAADDEYVATRLTRLAETYEEASRRHTPEGIATRRAVVREIGHLPYSPVTRPQAALLLGRILRDDRSYGIRADTARAMGRLGTPRGLAALYAALFGADGRSGNYDLLYHVLPDALAGVRDSKDLAWIAAEILQPAAARKRTGILRQAAELRWKVVTLTLRGVARAGAGVPGPEITSLAKSPLPAIRRAALDALIRLGHAGGVVAAAVADPDPRVRRVAARSSELTKEQRRALMMDKDVGVRRAAIRASRQLGGTAVDLLLDRLREDPALRLEIVNALVRISGRDFGSDEQLWRGWWAANRTRFAGPRAAGPDRKEARAYFFDVRIRANKVVFLIDVSASMAADDGTGVSRLDRAASEVLRTIGRLPGTARYRVYAFASAVRDFPQGGKWNPAGKTGANAAARWLKRILPSGATNTYGALMTAFEDKFQPDTIIVLSDGNPNKCTHDGKNYSEHEQILAEVRRVNEGRDVRVHAVALLTGGVDATDDRESAGRFLQRLAQQNDGDYREVR